MKYRIILRHSILLGDVVCELFVCGDKLGYIYAHTSSGMIEGGLDLAHIDAEILYENLKLICNNIIQRPTNRTKGSEL